MAVAEKNAATLGADVQSFLGDLLQPYPYSADIILANLPYVDRSWDQSPELASEPERALYADDDGLSVIKRMIDQAEIRTKTGALLLLEADRGSSMPWRHMAASMDSRKSPATSSPSPSSATISPDTFECRGQLDFASVAVDGQFHLGAGFVFRYETGNAGNLPYLRAVDGRNDDRVTSPAV